MIEFERVRCRFQGPDGSAVVAVDDLELHIATGEVHCLLGPSGCGKTTALKTVNRLVEPESGTVRVGGEAVADQDLRQLRRRIGYVIQSGGLFPHMTVQENVELPGRLAGHEEAARRAAALAALDLVRLPAAAFGARRPAQLSGGQRQRVSLARALVLDPAYLLLDEPFSALDPITRRELHTEFRALKAAAESDGHETKTVVIVTHDIPEAMALGDRITVMRAGRTVQTGTPAELREAPRDEFVRSLLGNGEGLHG